MLTLANSEDLDEMPHNAAFHQGQHCLLRQKRILRESNTIYFKFGNYNLCPLDIYTMDHLKCVVSNQKEESISA